MSKIKNFFYLAKVEYHEIRLDFLYKSYCSPHLKISISQKTLKYSSICHHISKWGGLAKKLGAFKDDDEKGQVQENKRAVLNNKWTEYWDKKLKK